LYIDGIEIDFITQNGILLEAKYNSKLNEKQQKLFDSFDAKEKYVLKGFEGFALLDTLVD
ncbi:MAG: ATP-binding protein, partial [Campylobacterota bacterium]|nr:ATP-binding protein [Campylobacterota bacterium]